MSEFQNPNYDPGAERRMLVALLLVLAVSLITYPYLMRRQAPPAKPAAEEVKEAAPAPAAKVERPRAVAPGTPAAAVRQAETETETVIENDLYRITFSNRGAQVTSWVLKQHRDDRGEPLDLVHPIAAPQHGYPLSLYLYDENLRLKVNSALYVASVTGRQNAPAEVVFEYGDGETAVRKRFQFDHSHVVRFETTVTQNGGAVAALPAWPAGFGDQTVPAAYSLGRVAYQFGDNVVQLDSGDVSGGATLPGPYHWAGTADQYFAAVFLPQQPEAASLVALHHAVQVPKNLNKPDPDQMQTVSVLGAAVGNQAGGSSGRLYVGPKTLRALSEVQASPTQAQARLAADAQGPNLEELVDFGFFGILSKPLFLWLRWTYEHWVANWGWAIIILTLIINVALLPLKITSMKSALRMQKIAPQMRAIQEKYKQYSMRDPRKQGMQQEIAALYKREGVNPLSGCWPMLLQLPFLIAFYTMLMNAVELRHAGWLWIRDLSAPDPFYILPIAITVSMFAVQKMTPQGAMDPMQQKMMNIMMPLFIGFISFGFAAGLTLYWTMGNVIAIVQQMAMNRTRFGREVRAEAARRAARRASREKAKATR